MIQSSSCPQWRLDRPGPAGDHDGLAVVTPLTGTRSACSLSREAVNHKLLWRNEWVEETIYGKNSMVSVSSILNCLIRGKTRRAIPI